MKGWRRRLWLLSKEYFTFRASLSFRSYSRSLLDTSRSSRSSSLAFTICFALRSSPSLSLPSSLLRSLLSSTPTPTYFTHISPPSPTHSLSLPFLPRSRRVSWSSRSRFFLLFFILALVVPSLLPLCFYLLTLSLARSFITFAYLSSCHISTKHSRFRGRRGKTRREGEAKSGFKREPAVFATKPKLPSIYRHQRRSVLLSNVPKPLFRLP